MLELPGLLLGPWTRQVTIHAVGHAAPALSRAILDPGSRGRLGVVRRRSGPWARWLGREMQEVYETEDESLLCTVCAPSWLTWAWQVYDADEHQVAVVRGSEILDGFGRRLAVLRVEENARAGSFLRPDGVELGEWMVKGEETLLQFSTMLANEPFAKMALLGALLSQA